MPLKVEIRCPACGNLTSMDYGKVPDARLKVTCRKCAEKFSMHKSDGMNCRVFSERSEETADIDATISEDSDGWVIQHPACEGIEYKLSTLGGLIRSGLVTSRTQILPPGSPKYYEAKELFQLRKYFEQRMRLNKQVREED
ncbi:MAG: hypothetical protein KDC35_03710 [Acidobacteria bacterium]|nr:hypothetical protein [Acidobacteriota bacterium]